MANEDIIKMQEFIKIQKTFTLINVWTRYKSHWSGTSVKTAAYSLNVSIFLHRKDRGLGLFFVYN